MVLYLVFFHESSPANCAIAHKDSLSLFEEVALVWGQARQNFGRHDDSIK